MALILLALLFRAAIPAGYMLAPGEGALPQLVLCSGEAAGSHAAVGHHGAHHGEEQGQSGVPETPCAFAIALAPTLPGAPPSVTSNLLPASPPPIVTAAVAAALPRISAALPPPATGPPFRA